jgi:hypothetical protein
VFEASGLLERDQLVCRAAARPDAYFGLLDETGREIGRVIEQDLANQDVPTWLVVYDRQNTPVLAVEKGRYSSDGRSNPSRILDGQGVLVTGRTDGHGWVQSASGERLLRVQARLRPVGTFTIEDSTRTETATLTFATPPAGDDRPGLTFLLTITAQIPRELRLAVLGHAISLSEDYSHHPGWMLKAFAKAGIGWPGGMPPTLRRTG